MLTDKGGKVEIVSKASMGRLTLGFGDTSVNVTTDLDGDEIVGNQADKAIASYNNVITRINEYCDEVVTATDNGGVRSVLGRAETAGNYSSTNFNLWFKNKDKVKVKAGDEWYEKEDYVKMLYWGIAGTGVDYYLPSRIVEENSSEVKFSVLNINGAGESGNVGLWGVNSNGSVGSSNPSSGVRPVVINPSGI